MIKNTNIRFAAIIARHFFCWLITLIMFFGVVQIGLKWESKQFIGVGTVTTYNHVKPVIGLLTQDWIGDYTMESTTGEKVSFAFDRVLFMSIMKQPPLGVPWRLMISILFGLAISAITYLGALKATDDWQLTVPRPTKPPVRADAQSARNNGPKPDVPKSN